MATIAQLAPGVGTRLQDPTFIFWSQQYEVYPALAEAISDMMLLIGRPTIIHNLQISLTPGTVWQPMPANIVALTNISINQYSLWKTSLHAMDYLQASWGPDWESDVADLPLRWGPLGLNYFFVHPAPSTAIQVNVTGVTAPIQDTWPPTGAETSPFHDEFDVALQMYAAAYLRIKEIGDDALEGNTLFQQYLDMAQRLSTISDRQDPLIFSRSLGVPTTPSLTSMR